MQRALAESETIISDMRSKLDIVNAEKSAAINVDRWMSAEPSNHEISDPEYFELVMVDNKDIQEILMQRTNS